MNVWMDEWVVRFNWWWQCGQVNGYNLENVTHDEAANALKNTQDFVRLVIAKAAAVAPPPPPSSTAPPMSIMSPRRRAPPLGRYGHCLQIAVIAKLLKLCLCLHQRSGWRHYIPRVFVFPCMHESRTNIVNLISWVDGIWPNFRHWRTSGQAGRQPRRGPGKHSPGTPNILTGPSGEKTFEFFLFKMVHSGVLYISGRRRGLQTLRGPGWQLLQLLHLFDGPASGQEWML